MAEKEKLENPFHGLQAIVYQRKKPLPPINKSKINDNTHLVRPSRIPIRVSKRAKLKKIPTITNRRPQGTCSLPCLPRTLSFSSKSQDDVIDTESMETPFKKIQTILRTENTPTDRLVVQNDKVNKSKMPSTDFQTKDCSNWLTPHNSIRIKPIILPEQQQETFSNIPVTSEKRFKTNEQNSAVQNTLRISKKCNKYLNEEQCNTTSKSCSAKACNGHVVTSSRAAVQPVVITSPQFEQSLNPFPKRRPRLQTTKSSLTRCHSDSENLIMEWRILAKTITKISKSDYNRAGIPLKPRLHKPVT